MHNRRHTPSGSHIVLACLVLAAAVTACGTSAPPADSPGGVVQAALGKLAAKDIDGLKILACAGQEDLIRQQLGLAGVVAGADLLPGLDTQALLDAVTLDVSGVKFGTAAIDGEVATVPVTGSVKATFDAARMRPLLKQVLERQGQSMTDDQLDALLKTLATYGQDVPVDQTIRLTKEAGAWKICQESIAAPSLATP
ncbi:MAG TPA: hypothetical protein VGK16_09220 [Candidatus Limnocylindrales bacterium]|jgi:hypothetical protein